MKTKLLLILALLNLVALAKGAEIPVPHEPPFVVLGDPFTGGLDTLQVNYIIDHTGVYRVQYSPDMFAWTTFVERTISITGPVGEFWTVAIAIDPSCEIQFARLVEFVP